MTQGKTGWIQHSKRALGYGSVLLLSVGLIACGEQGSVPPVSAAGDLHLEAESGTISPLAPQDVAEPRSGGRIILDPTASGGRAVALWGTNDNVRFVVPGSVKAGRYTVSVRGRGDEYRGWPIVDLNDARQRRLAVATLDSASYVTRKFGEFELKPGQVFNLSFINDLYVGRGQDRNAIVDYLVIEPVNAQPTSTPYTMRFGSTSTGYSNDIGRDVVVDAGGNAYVTGETTGTLPGQPAPATNVSAGNLDAFIRKVDAQGREVWTRQIGTDKTDRGVAVGVDAAGNSYVVGETYGVLPGQADPGPYNDGFFVRKYDAQGQEVWTRQFNTPQTDSPSDVSVDAAGNVYVVGYTTGVLPGQQITANTSADGFIRKYTADGVEAWTVQLGTNAWDVIHSVSVDAAGNVHVAGRTDGEFPGFTNARVGLPDAFVSRFTASGQPVWTRQFGSVLPVSTASTATPVVTPLVSVPPPPTPRLVDGASHVQTDQAGNVYVLGWTNGALPGQTSTAAWSLFLRKYTPSGTELWTRQTAPTSNLNRGVLGVDGQGNAYVTSEYEDSSRSIQQYTPEGQLARTLPFGTGLGSYVQVQALTVGAAGHLFLTGKTEDNFPNDGGDVFVTKLVP